MRLLLPTKQEKDYELKIENKQNSIKAWINAARLRTLPLSISGILVGGTLAKMFHVFDWGIFLVALATTIMFQVTSNFANDYGDGVKGTDNENRVGPARALQSGLLTAKQLKAGIIVAVLISFILVLVLLFLSFTFTQWPYLIFFLMLGALSIWAAIKYTVGENAYGYRGLGDVFVFLFFGLVGVVGSFFLFHQSMVSIVFLPAITIGAMSVGVLNLNNLRDYVSDKESGKNTLVVKMGFKKGKYYHYVLLAFAFLSALFFALLHYTNYLAFIPLLSFIFVGIHVRKVMHTTEPFSLDPELKKLALSTFAFALLFCFSYWNFS